MFPIIPSLAKEPPWRHLFVTFSLPCPKARNCKASSSAFPVSRRAARRFVAGERLEDAIDAIRATNVAGMAATLDFLGEHVDSQAEARVNADEYIRALHAIQQASLDANISIKLTAMGLAVDDAFCYQNVRRIVQAAAELGNFVRIDMEDSPVTDRTIAIYRGCVTSSITPGWWCRLISTAPRATCAG